MKIIVLAERFGDGAWSDWEHTCDKEEVEAVVDSAKAKAADRKLYHSDYIDFLTGAAYIFDVAYGPQDNPKDGDVRVYGAIADGMLIGIYDKIEHHFVLKLRAA
ncbi:MAG TPA: hypothetical protein VGI45_08165 [Terracidiphilus sp.]|jgi:hypothetical protein